MRGVPRPSPVKSSRYLAADIVERIERMRVACGLEPPDIYRGIGMKQTAWWRKWHGKGSTFSTAELGAIAEFFSRKTGKALTGWPIVDSETSDLLDALRRRS